MTWWERLNKRMDTLEMSAPQLADATGLPYSMVRKYLTGQVDNPRGKVVLKLAEAVGSTEEYLRTGLNPPSDIREDDADTSVIVPELDARFAAGFGQIDYNERVKATWVFPEEYAREVKIHQMNIAMVEVIGDSNSPLLESGDRVLIDQNDINPANPGIFALLSDGALVIKMIEVIPLSDPPMVRLISANKEYTAYDVPGDTVNIMGRVKLRVTRI